MGKQSLQSCLERGGNARRPQRSPVHRRRFRSLAGESGKVVETIVIVFYRGRIEATNTAGMLRA
jgi:hypothetical protein